MKREGILKMALFFFYLPLITSEYFIYRNEKKNYVMLLKKNNKKCIIIKYYDTTLRELVDYYLYIDTNDFKNCIEYINMGNYKPIDSWGGDIGYSFKFYPSQDYFKEEQEASFLMGITFINNKKVISLRLELPMNGNYVNIDRTKVTILTTNPTLGEKIKEQLSIIMKHVIEKE